MRAPYAFLTLVPGGLGRLRTHPSARPGPFLTRATGFNLTVCLGPERASLSIPTSKAVASDSRAQSSSTSNSKSQSGTRPAPLTTNNSASMRYRHFL